MLIPRYQKAIATQKEILSKVNIHSRYRTIYSAGIMAKVGIFEAQTTRLINSGNRFPKYYLREAVFSFVRCTKEYNQTIACLKDFVIDTMAYGSMFKIRKMIKIVIKELRKAIIPVRENRFFERIRKHKSNKYEMKFLKLTTLPFTQRRQRTGIHFIFKQLDKLQFVS